MLQSHTIFGRMHLYEAAPTPPAPLTLTDPFIFHSAAVKRTIVGLFYTYYKTYNITTHIITALVIM